MVAYKPCDLHNWGKNSSHLYGLWEECLNCTTFERERKLRWLVPARVPIAELRNWEGGTLENRDKPKIGSAVYHTRSSTNNSVH